MALFVANVLPISLNLQMPSVSYRIKSKEDKLVSIICSFQTAGVKANISRGLDSTIHPPNIGVNQKKELNQLTPEQQKSK